MSYVLGVFLRLDQIYARRLAALDLVLQAGTCAVAVVAVFALAYEESLLQQAQAFADRAGARIGAEVASRLLLRAPVNTQSWKLTGREEHIGIGLIVPQQDVVRRSPLFDQGLLEQQRLGLVGGDGGFDLSDLGHQGGGLRRLARLAEIAGQTLLEILGFADVEKFGLRIEHAVDARPAAAGGQERRWVEGFAHQLTVSTIPWRTASRASSTSLVIDSFSKMR